MELGTFDDREITATSIAITGAGDGLSKAMKVDPLVLHSGDRVFVVLECKVGPITHRPIEDSHSYVREHRASAIVATIVDRQLVAEVIEAQIRRIEDAEQVDGQGRLSPEAKQESDHAAGLHSKRRRAKCPTCESEKEAAALAKAERASADPLGVGNADEVAAKRAAREAHGDGEGDSENPLPAARKRRTRPSRAKGAKKA